MIIGDYLPSGASGNDQVEPADECEPAEPMRGLPRPRKAPAGIPTASFMFADMTDRRAALARP